MNLAIPNYGWEVVDYSMLLQLRAERIQSFVIFTILFFPHSWVIIGLVTRTAQCVPLVDQGLLTLPELLMPLTCFGGVRISQSLAFCVMVCWSLFAFRSLSIGHCIVCSYSIYIFRSPSLNFQAFLKKLNINLCFYGIYFRKDFKSRFRIFQF